MSSCSACGATLDLLDTQCSACGAARVEEGNAARDVAKTIVPPLSAEDATVSRSPTARSPGLPHATNLLTVSVLGFFALVNLVAVPAIEAASYDFDDFLGTLWTGAIFAQFALLSI